MATIVPYYMANTVEALHERNIVYKIGPHDFSPVSAGKRPGHEFITLRKVSVFQGANSVQE